jgi:hypothetical protein
MVGLERPIGRRFGFMERSEEELIAQHIGHDEELRRHVEDHKNFEKTLEELNSKVYLTPEEEIEKKNLQKMKLIGKEKLYAILLKYRSHQDS